jgi:hypothetical protein
MTNWNDRDWWQEVDLPEFPKILRENLPVCVGYTRGMGESAFEKHYIADGKPFIFCGEGIHRGNDIYQVMKDFIDACPNRPLFIFNLVNHSIPMDHIKEAMDRFSDEVVELVHLDELLLLIEKAFEEGKITEELYPHKEGLKKILAKEARQAWPSFYKNLQDLQSVYAAGESVFIEKMRQGPIGLEQIKAGDFLAFATIWNGMKLVKLALETRGIYVNHKPTANKKFLQEFNQIPDVIIIAELEKLWNAWHTTTPDFADAKKLANRFMGVAEHLTKIYIS